MLCEYGCNIEARYTMSNGKQCCSKHYSSCPAIKAKNSKSIKYAHAIGKIPGFNNEQRQKSIATKKKNAMNNFLKNGSNAANHTVKNFLKDLGVPECCSECGLKEWRGQLLPLELDHINGKNFDNRIENLRLLCPNCHSLTDTWRGKNINSGKIKVLDKDILTAYKKTANIRQTLIEVGLSPKGGNYARVKKLISGRGETGETHWT